MLIKEDLKGTGIIDADIEKVIKISTAKFAVEKSKIENETFGKALGEADAVLKDFGFEKKGKTTDSLKIAFSEMKTEIEKIKGLKKEIETLKNGGDEISKILEKKNKDLMQINLDMKKNHAESLSKVENEKKTFIRNSMLRAKIPNKGLAHLDISVQEMIISKSMEELAKYDFKEDKDKRLVFLNKETGLPITKKDGFSPKSITDLLADVPSYSSSIKKEHQENTRIKIKGENQVIPIFENPEEIITFLEKKGFSGDELTEKFIELNK